MEQLPFQPVVPHSKVRGKKVIKPRLIQRKQKGGFFPSNDLIPLASWSTFNSLSSTDFKGFVSDLRAWNTRTALSEQKLRSDYYEVSDRDNFLVFWGMDSSVSPLRREYPHPGQYQIAGKHTNFLRLSKQPIKTDNTTHRE